MMCTAVTYRTQCHYFGRNLDLEGSFQESVTVTPRNYRFSFRGGRTLEHHYAMIGMAYVREGYPLYYDATNEKGLSVAGLNFPESAVYSAAPAGEDGIAPFELIPWILSQCASVEEACSLMERTRLIRMDFSPELPVTSLHWMVADKNRSVVLEPLVGEGVQIFENTVGVLTNEPPFPMQLTHLRNYLNLTAEQPKDRFGANLTPYSRGMGAMGLPGDVSSASRFVRAAFTRLHSVSGATEAESVSQFFHILDSVAQTRGCVRLEDGKYEFTVYSSCCNTDKGIYYCSAYDNSSIMAVDMYRCDLESGDLTGYLLDKRPQIPTPQ